MIAPKQLATIKKYLLNYAEPEITLASHITDQQYQRVIVIPLFNENDSAITRIIHSPLASEQALLIIAVINQPDNIDNTHHNLTLWNNLSTQYSHINHSDQHRYLLVNNNIHLLLVNRFTQKIPHKKGVGLARKIGGDIACQLILQGTLHNPWIHHSDADTHLPDNYFSALDKTLKKALNSTTTKEKSISAAVYTYTHTSSGNAAIDDATQRYQHALQYYVDGLTQAQSPYAYHTLGSCIATHAYYYCQARGFPQKAGGEDFYLLNKLAKLGQITTLQEAVLQIESRQSDRVPFGTGPAIEKIMAMAHPEQEYLYYHPQCFIELKKLLQHFNTLYSYTEHHRQQRQQKTASNTKSTNTIDHYLPWLQTLDTVLHETVMELGIEKLLTHIDKQVNTHEQCIHHCHDWLDGFKTLKLIHLLEKHYPKQSIAH